MVNVTNPDEAWTTTGSTGGAFSPHLDKVMSIVKKNPPKNPPPVNVEGKNPPIPPSYNYGNLNIPSAERINLASPITDTSPPTSRPGEITNPTNPYEFMIGGKLPNEEQMKMMANQLRGMDNRAVLAALSGDKALTAAGSILTDKTAKLSEGLAKTRKTYEDRAFTSEENRKAAEAKLEQDNIANEFTRNRLLLDQRKAKDAEDYNQQYLSILGIKNEQTKQLKLEALNAKRDEKNRDRLIKLNDAYEKGGILDLEASFNVLDESLMPYLDESGNIKEGGGIPGIGNIQGKLPEILMTEAASEVRANFAKVANTILKARSGAAVTTPEMKRLAKELQNSIGTSDSKMMTAYRNLQKHTHYIREAMKQGFQVNTVDDLKRMDMLIGSGALDQLNRNDDTLSSAELEIIMDDDGTP